MTKKFHKPPFFPGWLFEKLVPYEDRQYLKGDFDEIYSDICAEKGFLFARSWYWFQIMSSIPEIVFYSIYWSFAMLKNYLKTALRNMSHQKMHAFINIFGLSIGIGFSILIFLFVRHEYSFDRFHENADLIYRVWYHEITEDGKDQNNGSTPAPLGNDLKNTYSEIKYSVRLSETNTVVKRNHISFTEDVALADPDFFKMFSFRIVKGDKKNPLSNLNSVVITQKTAEKYFDQKDPVGETVSIQLGKKYEDMTITAVSEDPPGNSSIKYTFIVHFERARALVEPGWFNNYNISMNDTYIQLKENSKNLDIEDKFEGANKFFKKDQKGSLININYQALKEVYLDKDIPEGFANSSNPVYSYILSGLGFLVLFIACVNFMTLSIGKSVSRSKEVGIRKVMGAVKSQLTRQFLGEAILTSFFSLLSGILLAFFLLPVFNDLSGKDLVFSMDVFTLFIFSSLVFFTGLTAGSYPAIVLSRFQPGRILKNSAKVTGKNFLSKGLIVLQFSLSVFLIVSTVIVFRQLDYLKNASLGYDKERIIEIPLSCSDEEAENMFERYKNEFSGESRIISLSGTMNSFGIKWVDLGIPQKNGDFLDFFCNIVSYDFIKTMGIELLEGRDFSIKHGSDRDEAVIVNEAFVKAAGLKDPLNKKIPGRENTNNRIIGVIKDFNYSSLHNSIKPLALSLSIKPFLGGPLRLSGEVWPPRYYNAVVRINKGETKPVIDLLSKKWKKVSNGLPFDFKFLDDTINSQYLEEQRWGKIINYSSVLAILIACLGLFGLTKVAVEKRVKEIGIRKVLGASVGNIIKLVSKELLILVVVANIIAWPVSYFVMDKWLQAFAYKINIGIFAFLASSGIALLIALATISFQTIKAAYANPVNSLRNE